MFSWKFLLGFDECWYSCSHSIHNNILKKKDTYMKAIDSTKLAKMTEFLLTNIGDKFIRASSEKSVNYLINFYKTKGIEITDELVISVLTKAKSSKGSLAITVALYSVPSFNKTVYSAFVSCTTCLLVII